MTDIVSRLRQADLFNPEDEDLYDEAAAEIERLRAERNEWRSWAEFAEAKLSALLEMLPPPESGVLKRRTAEIKDGEGHGDG